MYFKCFVFVVATITINKTQATTLPDTSNIKITRKYLGVYCFVSKPSANKCKLRRLKNLSSSENHTVN